MIPQTLDKEGDSLASADSQRRRAVLVGGALVVGVIGAVALGIRQFLVPLAPTALIIGVVSAVALLSVPAWLRAGVSIAAAGFTASLIVTVNIVGLAATTGGLAQPVLMALPVIPIFAVFVVGSRGGTQVAVLVIAALWGLFALHKLGHQFHEVTLEDRLLPMRAVLGTVAVAISTLLGTLYEKRRLLAEAQIIDSERQLAMIKDDFVSNVSHELRTPLTSIRGALALVDGGVAGALPPRAAKLVAIAHRNSITLVQLVNDLLDIQRVQSNNDDLNCTPQELGGILHEVVAEMAGYAHQFDTTIEVETGGEPAMVLADERRLAQVVNNLLSNAIKFSPRGSTVRLSSARRDTMVRVEVEDRGPGIPEPFIPRLFDKFTQAEPSTANKAAGSGLGLAIAKGFIDSMNGRIGVTSAEDHGSTFWFELPYSPEGPLPPGQDSSETTYEDEP